MLSVLHLEISRLYEPVLLLGVNVKQKPVKHLDVSTSQCPRQAWKQELVLLLDVNIAF